MTTSDPIQNELKNLFVRHPALFARAIILAAVELELITREEMGATLDANKDRGGAATAAALFRLITANCADGLEKADRFITGMRKPEPN